VLASSCQTTVPGGRAPAEVWPDTIRYRTQPLRAFERRLVARIRLAFWMLAVRALVRCGLRGTAACWMAIRRAAAASDWVWQ
jgi:hypothetical protein